MLCHILFSKLYPTQAISHSLEYSMAYIMLPYYTFLWYIAGVLFHLCAL